MYRLILIFVLFTVTGCQHSSRTEIYHCKSVAIYPLIAIGMDCNGQDVLLLDDSR